MSTKAASASASTRYFRGKFSPILRQTICLFYFFKNKFPTFFKKFPTFFKNSQLFKKKFPTFFKNYFLEILNSIVIVKRFTG